MLGQKHTFGTNGWRCAKTLSVGSSSCCNWLLSLFHEQQRCNCDKADVGHNAQSKQRQIVYHCFVCGVNEAGISAVQCEHALLPLALMCKYDWGWCIAYNNVAYNRWQMYKQVEHNTVAFAQAVTPETVIACMFSLLKAVHINKLNFLAIAGKKPYHQILCMFLVRWTAESRRWGRLGCGPSPGSGSRGCSRVHKYQIR